MLQDCHRTQTWVCPFNKLASSTQEWQRKVGPAPLITPTAGAVILSPCAISLIIAIPVPIIISLFSVFTLWMNGPRNFFFLKLIRYLMEGTRSCSPPPRMSYRYDTVFFYHFDLAPSKEAETWALKMESLAWSPFWVYSLNIGMGINHLRPICWY